MLQTRVVGNIGVLIYDYVIPTMQTWSSNNKSVWNLNNPVYFGDMDFNPANQQLLRWYGKCYHSLNDTMLLDMIKPQVQNK